MTDSKSTHFKIVIAKVLTLFFYIATFLNIGANYIGSPIVKYLYLLQLVAIAGLCFVENLEKIIWPFIIFSLFEGQGRVVWGYNPIFRLVFDILLALIAVRGIILTRSFFSKGIVPGSIRLFFTLHLIWFCLELFNPNGAGFFPSLATSKYYIFPMLLFFYFLNFPSDLKKPEVQKNLLLFFVILICLAGLTVVQNMYRDAFMDGISINYKALFPSYDRFRGLTFRPWGTTFIPGGMGVYYFLSFGLIFLINPKIISNNTPSRALVRLTLLLGTMMILFSSFIGQVRSATLKLVGVVLLYYGLKFLSSKVKARWVSVALFTLVFTFTLGSFISLDRLLPADLDISMALQRWEGMASTDIGGHRAGFDKILSNLEERVELPFGYGLGMTQSFLPAFAKRREQYVDRPLWYFWSMDNLAAFLILELGVGALFYIFLIISVNISLFGMMINALRKRAYETYSILSLSFTMVFIITIFSWGSVSIPFNPVSFFFWFWAALGISHGLRCQIVRNSKVETPIHRI